MLVLSEIARTPTLLVLKLRKLERQGRYFEALQNCLEVVDGKACVPALEGTTPAERAELLLRYGALIGFMGHNSQIASSQEQSKDLLTRALAEFLTLGDEEKAAECENYIALAYWRLGELNEASVWLENSFHRKCPQLSDSRLYAHVIESLVSLERKDFAKNVASAKKLEEDFLEFDDPFLTASFYANLGISLKDLGLTADALTSLELARHYHNRSGHRLYLGTITNSLAQVYALSGNFSIAHRSIDNATKIFRKLKDKTREAYSLDTKAHVFILEKQYVSALRTIDKAIEMLKRGESAAYCVEAVLTRAKVLLYLDRISDAIASLVEAIEINRAKIGGDAVVKLVEEFEKVLREVHGKVEERPKPILEKGLHLIVPASMAHYRTYSGVWMHDANLDRYGLRKGSLAVVVEQDAERGDLVAIEELKTGAIRCGIYDTDFGLVCLDRGDDEPQLFNADEVRVLGKIVGVGDERKEGMGEIVVEPLPV
jgi:tetratricopeptide (TPR) repeat protein